MPKHKIFIGPADNASTSHPLMIEGLVVDDFSPGELLVQTASGLATSTKAATVFDQEALVAIEQGAHVGADISTKWVVGETGKAVSVRSGEFANVFVATGNNLTTKGMALASNAAGLLAIAATDGSEQILFYSDEIVNVVASQLVTVRKA